MFIKIKEEVKTVNTEVNAKSSSISRDFEFDDNAYISDVKQILKGSISIPVENQLIKTLNRTFDNYESVANVWEDNSVAMLFNTTNEEPSFVCFLLRHNGNESNEQLLINSNLKSDYCHKSPSSIVSSTITLVADSDEESTESDGSSNSSESESGSTDSSDASCSSLYSGQKRKHSKSNTTMMKKSKGSPPYNQYSERISTYLEEFPHYDKEVPSTHKMSHKDSFTESDSNNNIKTCQSESTKDNGEKAISTKISESCDLVEPNLIHEDHNLISNSRVDIVNKLNASPTRPRPQMNDESVPQPTSSYRNVNKLKALNTISNNYMVSNPSAIISPDKREFLLILKNESKDISNKELKELMNTFFEKFHQSESLAHLHFNELAGINFIEGNLWFGCEDKNTMDFMIKIAKSLRNEFIVQKFEDSQTFYNCSVVIPGVCKSKNFKDVFELLEKQNNELNTSKWIVKNRQILNSDSEDKSTESRIVSKVCSNELINLLLDLSSKTQLESQSCKIKYCFWNILFVFK